MGRSRPLWKTHPEFSVLEQEGLREYRVENWHLARDGSQRVINGATGLTWRTAIGPVLLSIFWLKISESLWSIIGISLVMIYMIWSKCTQILFESVLVIPPHGIQLETHRGFPPSFILSTSRRFIPSTALQDFVINEGLRRWNVRYYLAAVHRVGLNDCALEIAFENILPHFPVLLEVYTGVQNTLFSK